MTKQELQQMIDEAVRMQIMSESNNEIDMFEESVILQEKSKTLFISSQGKQLKDQVQDIIYENTTRLGGFDKIKAKLFGANGLLNPNEAKNVIKGLSNLFDNFHSTTPFRSAGSASISFIRCTATKGKYMYRFDVRFTQSSSKMVTLSFNETIMDGKSFNTSKASEIINFAIKNCKPEFVLRIAKGSIDSGKIMQGNWEPTSQNVALYSALQKKFPNDIAYDDATGKCRFKIGSQI